MGTEKSTSYRIFQKTGAKKLMDTEILKEFVALETEKAKLKSRLGEIDLRRADLSDSIKDSLLDEGIDKITIHGRTIFLKKTIWAKIESTREEVIEALKKANLEEYVTTGFNSQSLSAYIRNQVESGEPLPEELNGHIKADEVITIRSA